VVTKGLIDAFFIAPPDKPPGHEQGLGMRVFRQQGDRFQVDHIRPFLIELGWAG
jgi:hypothetical protein